MKLINNVYNNNGKTVSNNYPVNDNKTLFFIFSSISYFSFVADIFSCSLISKFTQNDWETEITVFLLIKYYSQLLFPEIHTQDTGMINLMGKSHYPPLFFVKNYPVKTLYDSFILWVYLVTKSGE